MTRHLKLIFRLLVVSTVILQSSLCLSQSIPAVANQQESDEAAENRRRSLSDLGDRILNDGEVLEVILSLISNDINERPLEAINLVRPNPSKDDFIFWCIAATLEGKPQKLVRVIEKHLELKPKSVDANALRYSLIARSDSLQAQGINLTWKKSASAACESLVTALATIDSEISEYTMSGLVSILADDVTMQAAYRSRRNNDSSKAPTKEMDRWVDDINNVKVFEAIIGSPNVKSNYLLKWFHYHVADRRIRSIESSHQSQILLELHEAVLTRSLVDAPEVKWGTFQVARESLRVFNEDLVASRQSERGLKLLDRIESKEQPDEELAAEQSWLVFENRIFLAKHCNTSATEVGMARIRYCQGLFEEDPTQFVSLMHAYENSFLAVDLKGFTKVYESFKESGLFKIKTFGPLFLNEDSSVANEYKIAYTTAIGACFSRFVSAGVQPRFYPALKELASLDKQIAITFGKEPRPLMDDEFLINQMKFDFTLAEFETFSRGRTLLNEFHLEHENWLNRDPKSATELRGKIVVLMMMGRPSATLPNKLRGELESLIDRTDVFFSALERGDRTSWRPKSDNDPNKQSNPHLFPVVKIYNNTLSSELLDYIESTNSDDQYRIFIFDQKGKLRRLISSSHARFESIVKIIDNYLISEGGE